MKKNRIARNWPVMATLSLVVFLTACHRTEKAHKVQTVAVTRRIHIWLPDLFDLG